MLKYITILIGVSALIELSYGGGLLDEETYPGEVVSSVDLDFAAYTGYSSPLVANYAPGHNVGGYGAAFAAPLVQAYPPATSYQAFASAPLIRSVPIAGYRASIGRYRPALRSYGASLRSFSAPFTAYRVLPSIRAAEPLLAGFRPIGRGVSLYQRIL